jgi:N-acetylglucosamine kinase-like BadF-type ATPase
MRQVEALREALKAALRAARLPADTKVRALVAGISGFDGGYSTLPALDALAERSRVVHDTAIAHAGALDGKPGIIVIAGTGSVALGNSAPDTPFVRAGGWGYFFGDEGSAVWIAHAAMRNAMHCEDRGDVTALRDRAFAFFGTNSLRAIQHAWAHGEISRTALAAFAPDVLACAAEGDNRAGIVRLAAAQSLVEIVATVDLRLYRANPEAGAPERSVARVGGLFRDAAFANIFGEELYRTGQRRLTAVDPVNDPALGALTLARTLGSA